MCGRDLKEGIDFYIVKGKYVFTEHYLKKRGYCCGNGCVNCPYKEKKCVIPKESQK
jgi:hypothetical protein